MASNSTNDDYQEAQELANLAQFEANNLIVMCLLLVTALVLGAALHRYHIRSLTESGLFILVGIVFGGIVDLIVHHGLFANDASTKFFFNHELFNLILLPHIIFEAGFSLPRDLFFTRIGSILVFAVGGTLVATAFTWLLIVAFAKAGLILQLSVIEAGALAALISAIDPVSTLTLFKVLKVHPDLHNLLFGESVLNDAVSIIIFRSIQRFFKAEFRPLADTFLAVLSFAEVATGSIAIGCLVAMASALVLKLSRLAHARGSVIVEAGIFWIFSYGSFLVAESLALSGIVSALFCGIGMQRYAVPNLSAEARVAVPVLLQTVASLCETTVFVLVGLATWAYMDQSRVWTLSLVTMAGCLGGRALNIFGLAKVLNVRAQPEYHIPFSHQLVMWFSGLRGAIAVTLAVQVPGAHHDEIVMCTVVIVLFTTFVLGGLSEPLIRWARIERGPEVIDRFHAERKRRKREARDLFEDGSDFLIYAHRASEMSAHAHSRHAGLGVLARARARVQNAYNLLRDPRASWSLFAAASYIDRAYLQHWLIDRTVAESLPRRRAAARASDDDARRPSPHAHQQRQADDDGGGGGVGEGGDSLVSLPSLCKSSSAISEPARDGGATAGASDGERGSARVAAADSPRAPRKEEAGAARAEPAAHAHARGPPELLAPKLTTSRLAADESSDDDDARGADAGSLDALQAFVHDRSQLYGDSDGEGDSEQGDDSSALAHRRRSVDETDAPFARGGFLARPRAASDAVELGPIGQSRSFDAAMAARLGQLAVEQRAPAAVDDVESAPGDASALKRPSSR